MTRSKIDAPLPYQVEIEIPAGGLGKQHGAMHACAPITHPATGRDQQASFRVKRRGSASAVRERQTHLLQCRRKTSYETLVHRSASGRFAVGPGPLTSDGHVRSISANIGGLGVIGRILGLVCGWVALAGPAAAADYFGPEVFSPHPVSGYVDLHGGLHWGSESGTIDGQSYVYGDNWSGSVFGGAGRAAFVVSPNLTAQADAWTNVFAGSGSGSNTDTGAYAWTYTNVFSGIGGHLTWRLANSHLFGVFGSLGSRSADGTYVNIGVEGVRNYRDWRLYGQAGMTSGIGGLAGTNADKDLYGQGVIVHYLTEPSHFRQRRCRLVHQQESRRNHIAQSQLGCPRRTQA